MMALRWVCLAALVAVLAYRWTRNKGGEAPLAMGRAVRSVVGKRMEVTRWDASTPLDVESVIRGGEPVLLRGTSVSRWRALHRWKNASYLGTLKGVSVDGEWDTFVTADYSPAMGDGALSRDASYRAHGSEDMSAVEFFEEKKRFLYYYGKVGAELLPDVTPRRELWLHASDREHHGMYMWLSGAGVRPAVHFDSDHNFFVHIHGEKHFYLFPPWAWHALEPFPRVSRLWHKSRCDMAASEEELSQTCPDWREARALVAILEPGDVLYVPPYWWHQPVSVTACISVATWSQASLWNDHLRHIYYERNMTFMMVEPGVRPALLSHHFGALFEDFYGKTLGDMASIALKTRWRFYSDAASRTDCHLPVAPELASRSLEDARFVARTLRSIMPEANPAGNYKRSVISIEVFDYMERMVSRALGGADYVWPWLVCASVK